jgi:hypothetical protein
MEDPNQIYAVGALQEKEQAAYTRKKMTKFVWQFDGYLTPGKILCSYYEVSQ